MLGIIFSFVFSCLLALTTLLFGIISYHHKKSTFFNLGIISAAISLVIGMLNIEYLLYAIQNGVIMLLAPVVAWIGGIVFLILSKSANKSVNEDITDDFLNDIINAEDEEWDPES